MQCKSCQANCCYHFEPNKINNNNNNNNLFNIFFFFLIFDIFSKQTFVAQCECMQHVVVFAFSLFFSFFLTIVMQINFNSLVIIIIIIKTTISATIRIIMRGNAMLVFYTKIFHKIIVKKLGLQAINAYQCKFTLCCFCYKNTSAMPPQQFRIFTLKKKKKNRFFVSITRLNG